MFRPSKTHTFSNLTVFSSFLYLSDPGSNITPSYHLPTFHLSLPCFSYTSPAPDTHTHTISLFDCVWSMGQWRSLSVPFTNTFPAPGIEQILNTLMKINYTNILQISLEIWSAASHLQYAWTLCFLKISCVAGGLMTPQYPSPYSMPPSNKIAFYVFPQWQIPVCGIELWKQKTLNIYYIKLQKWL